MVNAAKHASRSVGVEAFADEAFAVASLLALLRFFLCFLLSGFSARPELTWPLRGSKDRAAPDR